MKLDDSQYRLRKTIGVLGAALPILLLVNHPYLLASMSHYYYTAAGVFFIGILTAFGLVLFTYQGYKRKDNEFLSDNTITNLAAIFIFITVLIPTRSADSLGQIYFHENYLYLFGHNNQIYGVIHLMSAAMFLALLGCMCYFKFTMSSIKMDFKKRFYMTCGLIIWICIGVLAIIFGLEKLFSMDFDEYLPAYTFWFEMIAVWAFAIAWLVKGKFDRDIQDLYKKIK